LIAAGTSPAVFAAGADIAGRARDLRSADISVRISAVDQLGDVQDARAVRALVNALKNEQNQLVTSHIMDAVAKSTDPAAADALIDIAENGKNAYMKQIAIRKLGTMNSDSAVKALLGIFKDEKETDDARVSAANALELQPPTGETFDAFNNGTNSTSEAVRVTSVKSLAGEFDRTDRARMISALKNMSKNSDARVRKAAQDQLDRLEPVKQDNGKKK
jgi:HEAT repeat protein